MDMLKSIFLVLLDVYIWIVIIRVLINWTPLEPYHPIVRFFSRLVDPVLWPLRGVMPSLRIQGVMLDLSPILLIVCLELVKMAIIVWI
jgi:YggT family protein